MPDPHPTPARNSGAARLRLSAAILGAAAAGLFELALVHRGAGPFQTGFPWLGGLVTAGAYGLAGLFAGLLALLAGRLGAPWVDRASAALPLAIAVPVAAGLLEREWGAWAPMATRLLELFTIVAGTLVAVGLLAGLLARVPPLVSLACSPRSLGLVTLGLLAFLGTRPQVAPGEGAADAPDGAPSVLLVTIDTLRADGVGAYGHAPARTPTIDGLAADGVLFETAVTPSVLTGPSHMSILSGLLPMQHGVAKNAVPLSHSVTTVVELAAEAGWDTGAFVSGYPVTQNASALLERFDHWDDDMRANRNLPRLVWRVALGRLVRQVGEPLGFDPLPKWRKAPLVRDSAVAWLERGDAPFLAWVHFYDAHLPYEAPAELISEEARRFDGPRGEDWYRISPDQQRTVIEDPRSVARMRELYDAEVALVDRELAPVIAAARERAGAGKLWVLVTSDHGESFGEHGIYYRRELFDPTLRVPMILGTPADGPKGVRVKEQVRLTDVAPTVLELLGIEHELPGEGVSLLALVNGSKSALPGPSISAIYGSQADPYQRFVLAVRNGRWKSIWRKSGWVNSDARWSPEERELFDLETDPAELTNLAAEQPDLWTSLHEMAGQVEVDLGSNVRYDSGALEALRDLGYVH